MLRALLVSKDQEEEMETLDKEELRVALDQRERKVTRVHLEIEDPLVVMEYLDCLVY